MYSMQLIIKWQVKSIASPIQGLGDPAAREGPKAHAMRCASNFGPLNDCFMSGWLSKLINPALNSQAFWFIVGTRFFKHKTKHFFLRSIGNYFEIHSRCFVAYCAMTHTPSQLWIHTLAWAGITSRPFVQVDVCDLNVSETSPVSHAGGRTRITFAHLLRGLWEWFCSTTHSELQNGYMSNIFKLPDQCTQTKVNVVRTHTHT